MLHSAAAELSTKHSSGPKPGWIHNCFQTEGDLDKKHRPRQLDLSAPCTNARNNCCVLIDSISHISVCWYIALLFPAGTLEALSLSSVLPNQELWGTISSPTARFLFWCKVESGPRVLTCHIHLTHTHTRMHAPAQYIPLWAQNLPWNIHFKYSHPTFVKSDPGPQNQSYVAGYICSNSPKYIVRVKIFHFSFYAKNH